jgi:hypothetical protein
VNRGILANELFSRVLDKNETSIDLKSVTGLNNESSRIISHCTNAQTLFLTEVGMSSKGMKKIHQHIMDKEKPRTFIVTSNFISSVL